MKLLKNKTDEFYSPWPMIIYLLIVFFISRNITIFYLIRKTTDRLDRVHCNYIFYNYISYWNTTIITRNTLSDISQKIRLSS